MDEKFTVVSRHDREKGLDSMIQDDNIAQPDPTDFPGRGSRREQIVFLLRFAIQAPSSHNSQPWRFSIDNERLEVLADRDRWLTVADPERRELYASIGCAIENFVVAAEYFGLRCRCRYVPTDESRRPVAVIDVGGEMEDTGDPDLFGAITRRQTNREPYDGTSIPEEQQRRLHREIADEDLELRVFDERSHLDVIEELTGRANRLQYSDGEFRRELAHWIGRGAFGTGRLASVLGKWAVTYLDIGALMARRDASVIRSAPVFAVITSEKNDASSQLRCGRAMERVWLRATEMGMSMQPMNQVLQVPEITSEFVERLEIGTRYPQLAFRIGCAEPPERRSPRRSVQEVLER